MRYLLSFLAIFDWYKKYTVRRKLIEAYEQQTIEQRALVEALGWTKEKLITMVMGSDPDFGHSRVTLVVGNDAATGCCFPGQQTWLVYCSVANQLSVVHNDEPPVQNITTTLRDLLLPHRQGRFVLIAYGDTGTEFGVTSDGKSQGPDGRQKEEGSYAL